MAVLLLLTRGMGCITSFILIGNITAIIALDIHLWSHSVAMGLIGLLGLFAFLIGYTLSVEISITPRDFWWNSQLDIFIKKIVFANSMALIVWIFVIFIAYVLGSDAIRDFVEWGFI